MVVVGRSEYGYQRSKQDSIERRALHADTSHVTEKEEEESNQPNISSIEF